MDAILELMYANEVEEDKLLCSLVNPQDKLTITDASPAAVKEMVKFFYTGNISSNIRNLVEELLQLAEKYSVGSLKKACERSLLEDLGVDCGELCQHTHSGRKVQLFSPAPVQRSHVLQAERSRHCQD